MLLHLHQIELSGDEVLSCRINELEKRIEETRERLYQAYQDNSDADQVLAISQELDMLLNAYKSTITKEKKVGK